MEEKQVKKLPPFSHIKVLENGNYSCTLLVADKIYNGIFTQNWDCIEKLHLVKVDAYTEYDNKDADVLIPMPVEDGDTPDIKNKVAYAESIYLNLEDEDDVDINTKIIGSTALFCMQYVDKNNEVVINIENSLMPYKYIIYSFLKNLFENLEYCYCNTKHHCNKLCWDKVMRIFNMDYNEENMPFVRAIKKVYDEYNEYEEIALWKLQEKDIDTDTKNIMYDYHMWDEIIPMEDELKQKIFDGAYDLCYIFYMMYLRDNCKEYIDIEI